MIITILLRRQSMPSSRQTSVLTPRGDQRLPFVFSPSAPRLTALFLTLLFFLSSCQRNPDQNAPIGLSVTDDLGTVVSLPATPRRIVSLAPSITEILFVLNLDSAVAGVTDVCDYPDAARSIPKVGGMTSPNFERIVELNPDLVVMTVAGNARTDYDKMISLGLHVFVTNPESVEGVYKSVADLGRLSRRTGSADSLLSDLRTREKIIRQRADGERQKSVLLLLSLKPLIAAGPGTFLDELIRLANGRNAAAAAPTAYPMLSREEILTLQPEVILVTNDVAQSIQDVKNAYPEWQSIQAIQTNSVAIVDPSLISRPGPRIILGLQALVDAIHQ